MNSDFRNFSEKNIVVFDGAMGTMLYANGVYINKCYEELNLSNPTLVKDIHQSFISHGAMVIETNTFGANKYKLFQFGIADKVEEINRMGVRIAKEIAQGKAFVAGSIGPLGIRLEPWGKTSVQEAEEAFLQQAKTLIDEGVDLIILETFYDLNEIHQAIKAVKKLTNKPVIASMTINEDGNALYGTTPDVFTAKIDEWEADIIGLNCSVGPKTMYDAVERMRGVSKKKFIVQPNAGLPRIVDGRTIYLCNPEYFGEYAKRFIQLGIRMIGGCCGTTPEHIKWVKNAARAFDPGISKVEEITLDESRTEIHAPPNVKVIEKESKSVFARRLFAEKAFVVSCELTPPKGCDPSKIIETARELKGAGIDAINIPDGPRASARMSPMALAILIENQVRIETVLHYCCRDRNILGIQSDLLGAYAVGLRNILCITGDPPKVGNYPEATAVFDIDSIGLTNVVKRLNHGLDLGGNPIGKPTGLCIGVGANPGAIDLDLEIRRFEWKVKAGAEFAITQPVFDGALLEKFLQKIAHIRIPILAGIWPLTSLKNAEFMNNEVPGASVPAEIMQRMRSQTSIEGQQKEGIAIAREALKSIKPMVEGIQLSVPFGRAETVLKVLEAL
ncbi:MAG: bifunctional homocysteine S-methyltransferase/methylenetetrahydrofolate reductase [Candidatus Riflebacteria bacterium]|nr:bifunctional homocysteine S-methyltransferase/methylenetetrahydrofolate reductase [Candidatus Riflebacteria bacterium]